MGTSILIKKDLFLTSKNATYRSQSLTLFYEFLPEFFFIDSSFICVISFFIFYRMRIVQFFLRIEF